MNRNASDRRLTFLMRLFNGFIIFLSVMIAYFRPATIVAILGIS